MPIAVAAAETSWLATLRPRTGRAEIGANGTPAAVASSDSTPPDVPT